MKWLVALHGHGVGKVLGPYTATEEMALRRGERWLRDFQHASSVLTVPADDEDEALDFAKAMMRESADE